MSPVHAEQIKLCVPEDNGEGDEPELQPELELQPPRDAEEDTDEWEQACASNVAVALSANRSQCRLKL